MGADGSRSPVAQGDGPQLRRRRRRRCATSWAGRCSSLYFRSAELYDHHPASARLDVLDRQRDRRSCLFAVNGRDEFLFHTQLAPGRASRGHLRRRGAGAVPPRARQTARHRDHLARSTWNAGYTLVADNSGAAACSSAATPRICSRRPAGLATTPRSRMRSISAGSSPRC